MYFGTAFGPVSLLGLLFRGIPTASSVPLPAVSVIIPVRNGENLFLVAISIVGMWMTTQLQGFGIFGVVGG